MALTLAEARLALRRWLGDLVPPTALTDADLDAALVTALAQLDALAPRQGTVTLAAAGTDQLPLPSTVRRVWAVLVEGRPLDHWAVWNGTLLLGEPISGTVELRCHLARELVTQPDQTLPLTDPAEETYLLAAAVETLLTQVITVQARHQGPTQPLMAALAAVRTARERAAAALPRSVRVVRVG